MTMEKGFGCHEGSHDVDSGDSAYVHGLIAAAAVLSEQKGYVDLSGDGSVRQLCAGMVDVISCAR